jgi:hypothetical protein
VLGFELQQRFGSQAAFISAGGYHHHIGLNTWESRGGSPPPPGTTGLFHVAVLYPTRELLGDALRRLLEAGVPLDGPRTTASARPSTCATPTGTASSSTGTARAQNGPSRHRARAWGCSPHRSTSPHSSSTRARGARRSAHRR